MSISTLGNETANTHGSVTFPCPVCGEKIIRTRNEREIVAKYVCPKCGFEGPN